MPRKRKTLPKDFATQLKEAPLDQLIALFDTVELNATGGYDKLPALFFPECPPELATWLISQGADLEARDRNGQTPLHHRALDWKGGAESLLDLGADIGATDNAGNTVLHLAAQGWRDVVVSLLLRRGADPFARNHRDLDALELALATTSSGHMEHTAVIARELLAAGVTPTDRMRKHVLRLGTEFEFHSTGASYDPETNELVARVERGLHELYSLFDVPPVARLQRHDGVSPIQVPAGTPGAQHGALWDLLVPASGAATTVQGEIIRTSGKMADEILRNGGANWDRGFSSMLIWTVDQLGQDTPLAAPLLEEAAGLRAAMKGGHGLAGPEPAPERLMALAVEWVRLNPNPAPNSAPTFHR
ncbi:ankyrin repeat domain-containing protein [Galactobacter caseinivorans]|uniref:Ankyrin repeat domain-containing protein n=1 Tax=Galactobacter caseinivorans TaxID=2676123 RepID=A0A496PJ35_9MICC|nr:ankyrin repeat domain-containing protein [Galactobacter caseinivorans]RKW70430.1 ankyrin repeat domain-containing protein [Galactobacter caseinivorans]